MPPPIAIAYLVSKMSVVAPDFAALIGETVGACLLSHTGSLTKLAKCPASSVQILGAEKKAMFRALTTRGNASFVPFFLHWPCCQQEEGSYLPLLGEQVR